MYIRPHLSRKRTSNCEVLSKEHRETILAYDETLKIGEKYESDILKIRQMIDGVSSSDNLSEDEKQLIVSQLTVMLGELETGYTQNVEDELESIEVSLEEIVGEMTVAVRERSVEVNKSETTEWHTDEVMKDKLVGTTKELLQRSEGMLEKAKVDLQSLQKKAEDQRTRIRERISRG